MNNNSLKPFIKFMAIVLGGLFLIMFIYEVNSVQKRSCAAPGCKDQPIYGSDYCYQHRVNDENYEVESDSQESKTTALEEATTDSYYEVDSIVQIAVMIIVHQTIATVIQVVTQTAVHQVVHIVIVHQAVHIRAILLVVLQRRNIAIHTSLMTMDMKMVIWMMIMTMTDIIVIQIMQME